MSEGKTTAKTSVLTAVLQPAIIQSDTRTGTPAIAKIPLILGTSWLMHNQNCCTVPEVNSADWGVTAANMLQDNTTDDILTVGKSRCNSLLTAGDV